MEPITKNKKRQKWRKKREKITVKKSETNIYLVSETPGKSFNIICESEGVKHLSNNNLCGYEVINPFPNNNSFAFFSWTVTVGLKGVNGASSCVGC